MKKERKIVPYSSIVISDKELLKASLANELGIYTSVTKLPDGNNLLRAYIKNVTNNN